jgi:hypothetical protein
MQIIAKVETTAPICLETYKAYPQLGRFTLRDEGKTIAMGKVGSLFLKLNYMLRSLRPGSEVDRFRIPEFGGFQ